MIKAIETRYKGYRFRSRLEARWAVYFDALDIPFEYEYEGFNLDLGIWYLPDFWLPLVNMWAEVKPFEFTQTELEKVELLVRHTERPCLLLEGAPDCRSYDAIELCKDGSHTVPGETERCDYVVSNYHSYPRDEKRFYACTGYANFRHEYDFQPDGMFSDVADAVAAARSARFEHGESP